MLHPALQNKPRLSRGASGPSLPKIRPPKSHPYINIQVPNVTPPKGGLLCFPRGGRQRGGVRDDTLPALKHNLKMYHVTELSQTSTQACAHTYTLYIYIYVTYINKSRERAKDIYIWIYIYVYIERHRRNSARGRKTIYKKQKTPVEPPATGRPGVCLALRGGTHVWLGCVTLFAASASALPAASAGRSSSRCDHG